MARKKRDSNEVCITSGCGRSVEIGGMCKRCYGWVRYHVRAIVFDGYNHLSDYVGKVRLASNRISLMTNGNVNLKYQGKDYSQKIIGKEKVG